MLGRVKRSMWYRIVPWCDIGAFLALLVVVCWGVSLARDNTIEVKDKNSLLIGMVGLMISIPTVYATTVRPLLRKPRLESGDDVDPQWSEPRPDDTGSWFYRLKIENYGLTTAKGCFGRLIDVWTAEREQIRKFDPLNLFWARQSRRKEDKGSGREISTFQPLDIGGFRDFNFLDVAKVKGQELTLRVEVPPPGRLTRGADDSPSPGKEPILRLPGTYYIRIGVYAEDAHISLKWFEIACSEIEQPLSSEKSPCEITEVKRPRWAKK